MNDQWQELKETIIELRDNDGTSIQQELCTFLVNYMDILEKQMQEPCGDGVSKQAVLDIVDSYSQSKSNIEDVTQDIISDIMALSPVTPQPKTGHWGKDSECPFCGYLRQWNDDNFCGHCGAKLVEPQESEDKE